MSWMMSPQLHSSSSSSSSSSPTHRTSQHQQHPVAAGTSSTAVSWALRLIHLQGPWTDPAGGGRCRPVERGRGGHAEGCNPQLLSGRLRELEEELSGRRSDLSQPYCEIVLKHSSYKNQQQDRCVQYMQCWGSGAMLDATGGLLLQQGARLVLTVIWPVVRGLQPCERRALALLLTVAVEACAQPGA